jgi:hypothetical protein
MLIIFYRLHVKRMPGNALNANQAGYYGDIIKTR